MLALNDTAQVDKIVVSTDCDDIESVVNSLSFAKVEVHRRSLENAQDHSSTESVMLEYLNDASLDSEDIFVLVQATSPFTLPLHFKTALIKFHEEKLDSLLSVVKTKRFFWTEEGAPINYNFKSRPRRQDFNGCMMENGAFYVTKVASLLQYKNRLSGKIGVYEMPEYTSIEIDEPEDWIIAEALMSNLKTD